MLDSAPYATVDVTVQPSVLRQPRGQQWYCSTTLGRLESNEDHMREQANCPDHATSADLSLIMPLQLILAVSYTPQLMLLRPGLATVTNSSG